MITPSIGVCATFRDEVNALPGWLEMATAFFDEILLVDCSMDMSPSSDGSLDIIRKWGLPDPPRWDLSPGFGAVRSQLIQSNKADWCVIMDIDERMLLNAQVLTCSGEESYPAVADPKLIVSTAGPAYNQRDFLNEMIRVAEVGRVPSVRFCRRHWFDATYRRPTQNWTTNRDYQLRCIKSRSNVMYRPEVKMHEQLWDYTRNDGPRYIPDDPDRGPFLDHLHCHFKPMEPDQRRADIAAYDALHYSATHTPIPA